MLPQNDNILEYLKDQVETNGAVETLNGHPPAENLVKAYKGDLRVQILEEGINLTKYSRNETHGDFYLQHCTAADFWTTYLNQRFGLDIRVEAFDVASLQALLKQSRALHGGYNRDDYTDQSVYVAGAAECREKLMRELSDEA